MIVSSWCLMLWFQGMALPPPPLIRAHAFRQYDYVGLSILIK